MENQVMIMGVKESFLVKALEKKLAEAEYVPFFCKAEVDEIHKNWKEASLLVYYLDTQEHLKPDVLHFLQEHLSENGKHLLLVGDKMDLDSFCKGGLEKHVVASFTRPLDMERLLETIADCVHSDLLESRKKKILIVDDDTTYLGVVRDWLKDSYTVLMANSGLQAIKVLGGHPVDLILLDHEMPVTSGPKVLEMLRHDPETSSIPVIFLTGKSDKESVMQVMGLKPQGYLLKTTTQEELLYQLNKYFTKRA